MLTLALVSAGLLMCTLSCLGISNNTDIENHYETEFDIRPPRTVGQSKEYLVVRVNGFNKISHYTKEGTYIGTDNIANWERFALK